MNSDRRMFWQGVRWALRTLSVPSLVGVVGGVVGGLVGWVGFGFMWSLWSGHWKWPVPNYGVPIGFVLGAFIGVGILLLLEHDELTKRSAATQ
ncbi:MAG: hypothetical protein KBD16_00270 [Candidatus Pacebacteria bacterium]|nr:hypothetical protein [Candidatus Paceibacterota bacterium]